MLHIHWVVLGQMVLQNLQQVLTGLGGLGRVFPAVDYQRFASGRHLGEGVRY